MPPRLPALSGLRAVTGQQAAYARPFSATASLAIPPREAPRAHGHAPSSTSSLLSLDRQQANNHNRGPPLRSGNIAPNASAPGRRIDAAKELLSRFSERARDQQRRAQVTQEALREQKVSGEYLREMPRKWQAGDVYSPHDLSSVEMMKWRKRAAKKGDIIDALAVRPTDMYKNFSVLAEFTSTSGQILPSSKTGLRPVNQRKIAKMIRRAQGMGIYPSIHGHPDMIRDLFFPPRG